VAIPGRFVAIAAAALTLAVLTVVMGGVSEALGAAVLLFFVGFAVLVGVDALRDRLASRRLHPAACRCDLHPR
jgi:hypothetical protein